jgi:hypothetical protein
VSGYGQDGHATSGGREPDVPADSGRDARATSAY